MRVARFAGLRPGGFTRGRLAAGCCGVYLVLVVAAGVYTVYDAVFVETIGASFAALPLVVLTAPLSFVVSPVIGMVQGLLFPEGGGLGVVVLSVLLSFVLALAQAYLGWRVLRGRQLGPGRPPSPATP